MQFRTWVLYVLLNKVEDWMTNGSRQWSGISEKRDDNCWYSEYLIHGDYTEKCYGRRFDFSDHIVFFFSHMLPLLLFEATFSHVVPICPQGKSKHGSSKNENILSTPQRYLHLVLIMYVCYFHAIILSEAYFTAAYFHTGTEILIGMMLSLTVQIPLGVLMCSSKWRKLRSFFGLPSNCNDTWCQNKD